MLPRCWSSNTDKVQPVSIGRSPYVPEKCSGFPIGLSTKHQHELPNSTTLFDGSFMIFLVLGGGRMVVALLLIVHIHEKKQVQVSSSPSIMLPFAHLLIHFKWPLGCIAAYWLNAIAGELGRRSTWTFMVLRCHAPPIVLVLVFIKLTNKPHKNVRLEVSTSPHHLYRII